MSVSILSAEPAPPSSITETLKHLWWDCPEMPWKNRTGGINPSRILFSTLMPCPGFHPERQTTWRY